MDLVSPAPAPAYEAGLSFLALFDRPMRLIERSNSFSSCSAAVSSSFEKAAFNIGCMLDESISPCLVLFDLSSGNPNDDDDDPMRLFFSSVVEVLRRSSTNGFN